MEVIMEVIIMLHLALFKVILSQATVLHAREQDSKMATVVNHANSVSARNARAQGGIKRKVSHVRNQNSRRTSTSTMVKENTTLVVST